MIVVRGRFTGHPHLFMKEYRKLMTPDRRGITLPQEWAP